MGDLWRGPFPDRVEEEDQAGSKSGVEVVRVPRDPVVAVEDVGVGVVPRPMDELDSHNVVGDVDEDSHQTHCERLGVPRQV